MPRAHHHAPQPLLSLRSVLQQLHAHVELMAYDTLKFNIFNNFTIRQTPDIIAFSLRMFYSLSAFKSNTDVLKGGGARRVRNSNRRGCNLEVCLDRVGESVTERIIISYNTYPWGI